MYCIIIIAYKIVSEPYQKNAAKNVPKVVVINYKIF